MHSTLPKGTCNALRPPSYCFPGNPGTTPFLLFPFLAAIKVTPTCLQALHCRAQVNLPLHSLTPAIPHFLSVFQNPSLIPRDRWSMKPLHYQVNLYLIMWSMQAYLLPCPLLLLQIAGTWVSLISDHCLLTVLLDDLHSCCCHLHTAILHALPSNNP